jgi:hypothetical protein
MSIVAAALAYRAAGLSVVPTRPGEKRPTDAWKQYQSQQMGAKALANEVHTVGTVGIVTGYNDVE